jgi:hypothetical protein
MSYYNTSIDNRINGYAFLSLDESTLRQFGVSYGFKITLMDIIENLVCDKTFCSCLHAYCYMNLSIVCIIDNSLIHDMYDLWIEEG